ncbi:sensor histidine kinase [Paenirhodobacter populi]|nr:ATP-binding protein [Sinirhodobacter populi]
MFAERAGRMAMAQGGLKAVLRLGAPAGLSRRTRRILIAAGVLALFAVVLFETYHVSFQRGKARLSDEASATAQGRAMTLSSELAKQRAVALILADDRDVIEGLSAPTPVRTDLMSRKFEDLRAQTGSSVIYAVDTTGLALAASNWRDEDSFIGSNYGFRFYFTGAMTTGEAWEYALGNVSLRPGLYLSRRVEANGQPVGAIIVKVEFVEIEASWRGAGVDTVAVDPGGRVTLTSTPDWRFLPEPDFGPDRLVVSRPVGGSDWRLDMAVPLAPVRQEALGMTLIAALLALPLGLIAALWRQRLHRQHLRRAAEARYRNDLEQEVAARTRDLSEEIGERKAAERRLAAMQARLVQANKLAALGQITAGVAHEVNQPLATIRLLAENGEAMMPDPKAAPEVRENLGLIVQMTDRIARITSELRGFSRKARGEREPVPLIEAWEASLLLSASRRAEDRVPIRAPRIPPGLLVIGEKVRLEQVMVNLIQNAHEALAGTAQPEIRVTLSHGRRETDGAQVVTLTIADNGPGLSAEVAQNLFTPFLTTKREGTGLGLVISQGIMRDFGGRLWADPPAPGQGARFHLELLVAV